MDEGVALVTRLSVAEPAFGHADQNLSEKDKLPRQPWRSPGTSEKKRASSTARSPPLTKEAIGPVVLNAARAPMPAEPTCSVACCTMVGMSKKPTAPAPKI